MNPHPDTNTGVPPLHRAWEGDREVTPWGGMKVKGRRRWEGGRWRVVETEEEEEGIPKDTPPNTTPCPASVVSLLLLPHHPPKDGVVQVTLVCEA
jgi:hypothetical protein